jgi:hypothetical protein
MEKLILPITNPERTDVSPFVEDDSKTMKFKQTLAKLGKSFILRSSLSCFPFLLLFVSEELSLKNLSSYFSSSRLSNLISGERIIYEISLLPSFTTP